MPRLLSRFCRLLDELPQQTTERLEWRLRLGDDWPIVEPLLRRTGRVVRAVACPHPSGDGCPRRIVHHGDGRVMGVCGERPPHCEAITLEAADIDVLEASVASLCGLLRHVLRLGEAHSRSGAGAVVPLGQLGIRAGFGVPVVLVFPSAERPVGVHDLPEAERGVLLTPTGRAAPALPNGWTALSLADLLEVDDRGAIVATEAWTSAADTIKTGVMTTTQASAVVWLLPPDARWDEMTFDFVGPELLHVRFRGDSRAFEPLQLGMRSQRNGSPTLHWTTLQVFAECAGEISWAGPKAHPSLKKRKQLLSHQLIQSFGIPEDPIIWGNGAYRTRFRIGGWRKEWRGRDTTSYDG